VVDVETLEQPVLIVVLLLLLLLDGGDALSCFFLSLGMLVKSVPDLVLSFLDGGEPGVEPRVLHLLLMMSHVLIMRACGMVMVATSKEGHASSLEVTGDLLIRLLFVVVVVAVLPLSTRALLPGALRMMRRRLLLTCMLGMVRLGRSCLIKSIISGECRAFWGGVISTVLRIQIVRDPRGGTPT
jgi:hypothetical protein